MRVLIFFIAFVITFYVAPTLASSGVVINEVAYDLPGTDDPHEWIELYNSSSTEVDLTDWKFNDGANHILNIPPQKGGQGSLMLAADGFAILADDAATFLIDHPGFFGTVIDTVVDLGNTNGVIAILDATGSVVDTANYSSDLGASGNGKTLERENNALRESYVEGGTPGAPSSSAADIIPAAPPPTENTPPPSPPSPLSAQPSQLSSPLQPAASAQHLPSYSQATLRLSEILPNPIGRDSDNEYAELFNFGKSRIDLNGWKIINSRKSALTLSGMLEPEALFLAKADDYSLPPLTNIGDTIELLDPSGVRRDGVRYEKAPEGQALARSSDGVSWYWTAEPTPGAANIEAAAALRNGQNNNVQDAAIAVAPVFSASEPDAGGTPSASEQTAAHSQTKRSAAKKNGQTNDRNNWTASPEAGSADLSRVSALSDHSRTVAIVISLLAGIGTLVLRIWRKRGRELEFEVEEA